MKRAYQKWHPKGEALDVVRHAVRLCRLYAADGYDLSLRQIYYLFVAQDLFPDSRCWINDGGWKRHPDGTKNAEPNYKWLGDLLNKARLAGILDWDYIVDRTRTVRGTPHWSDPQHIVDSAASSHRLDKWATQRRRVEIWVEKDALAGVIERVAGQYDVEWFSCRGYVSQSEQWGAAQRLMKHLRNGQAVTILHLGDHDPSGIDMTRDIRARLATFTTRDWLDDNADAFPEDTVKVADVLDHLRAHVGDEDPVELRRIALNWDQVQDFRPPPNPTKLSDSRSSNKEGTGYLDVYGEQCWELDALPPDELAGLISNEIDGILDRSLYDIIERREARQRRLLSLASERWDEIVEFLDGVA